MKQATAKSNDSATASKAAANHIACKEQQQPQKNHALPVFRASINSAPPASLQTKLNVSSPKDNLEVEADQTADKVMTMPAPERAVGSASDSIQLKVEEEEVQEKLQYKKSKKTSQAPIRKLQFKVDDEEENSKLATGGALKDVQRYAQSERGPPAANVEQDIQRTRGRGPPMEPAVRENMEGRFGADFSNVTIHNDENAHRLNNDLNSQAFAIGQDVYFGRGNYNPQSSSGQWLLAHELTHTIQQSGGKQTEHQGESTASRSAAPAAGRAPPSIQQNSNNNVISRSLSWRERARNAVQSVGDFVADGLEAGKQLLLDELRDFVVEIPGYRALSVAMGRDPITGQPVARNGHNFLLAAFDIIPGGELIYNKLNELGAIAIASAWIDTKLAIMIEMVSQIRANISGFISSITLSSLSSPGSLLSRGAGIVQAAILSVTGFAITIGRELLSIIKQFLLQQLAEFISTQTTVYPLLKVVLGEDPITGAEYDRNGTNILNAFLSLSEEGQEQQRQMEETGTFQQAADWIDSGIAIFAGAYDQIVNGFTQIWEEASLEDILHPIDTFTRIYNHFAEPVARVLIFMAQTAAIILNLIKDALMRRLAEYASTVRGYELVTVILGKDPFTNEVVPRTVSNIIRGFMSLLPGGREQFNQMQESGAIQQAEDRINAAVETLGMTPQYIVNLFMELWNSFSISDLANPIQAFQQIIERFGEPISRLIAFIGTIIRIVIEVMLRIMNFPIDIIGNIISKVIESIELIKSNPVGFLINLLNAIKQGFVQFFNNILSHLVGGLQAWLVRELGDAGVPIPRDFTLSGIFAWILEVMNITVEYLWQKLGERIGPERVAMIRERINQLEGVWTFIKDVQERGMVAIWERIQERLSGLWTTVLDLVKNWIMTQIITRVTARLLTMLDPSGIMAVVNSVIAIYNAIQSFIQYLREMLEIINSFVSGVAEIAAGNISSAANFLENTMARGIPIVIGFLANQVGLSGIGRRIAEIIGRIREMVDRAVTWLIDRAVSAGGRLLEMGRGAVDTVLGWLGFRKKFKLANGEEHEAYFENETAQARIIIASKDPKTLQQILAEKKWNDKTISNADLQLLRGHAAEIDKNREDQGVGKGEIIKQEFMKIVTILARVGGPPIPATTLIKQDVIGSGSLEMGKHVKVSPLSLDPGGLAGSQPTITTGLGELLKLNYPNYIVEGHLLNHKLHGPGNTTWNLTPIAKKTNSEMNNKFESLAKNHILGSGSVVEYEVQVNYDKTIDTGVNSDPDQYVAKSLNFTLKELEYKDNKWQPKNEQPDELKEIPASVPHEVNSIPGFGTGRLNFIVDINSSEVNMLQRIKGVGTERALAIISYRNNHGSFTNFDQLIAVEGIGPQIIANMKNDPNVILGQ